MNRKLMLRSLLRTLIEDGGGGGGTAAPSEEVSPAEELNVDESEDSDVDADEDEGDTKDEEALGDPGKQALDRMKAKWRAERDRRKALEEKYEPPTDAEKSVTERANKKILRSEIKAAAAGKFNDPGDVYHFLDLEQFEVSEDGDVNEEEIADAISDLLSKKPYLAVTQGERRYKGSADGGVRKTSAPGQLTKADLANMSPQAILQADQQGRLNRIKGLK